MFGFLRICSVDNPSREYRVDLSGYLSDGKGTMTWAPHGGRDGIWREIISSGMAEN